MRAFEHASPTRLEDATALLAERPGRAVVLAGGTDLLSLLKDDVVAADRVVNVRRLAPLKGLFFDAKDGLRIGALTTLEELSTSEVVARHYPALRQAALGVTSPQVRVMGTVGGDLCILPHCWYYRSGFGLLAIKDGASLVEEGDNRYHAILGHAGPAKFVSASSLAPPLIALGARVTVAGASGQRALGLERFYRTPGKEGERPMDLAPDEILVEVLVPPPAGRLSAVHEVRQRQALDWPLASAAACFQVVGGVAKGVRIVLGHVAPVPWVSAEAARALEGQAVDEAAAGRAADAAVAAARPLSRNAYKVQVARTAAKRAVLRAAGKDVP
jgi:xanthine dehydrogenase YagS FAD-binding subunit